MPTVANSTLRHDPFDIISVPFPYVDRLAEKRRPALVVSTRRLSPHGLVWVAMITSTAHQAWSCDVPVIDLERAGLPVPCVIRTAKIAAVSVSRIERRAGRLDKATIRAVQSKLRSFVDLS